LNRPDYYEFLQISPNAEGETIRRVYRFLATRLHPDNPKTGDAEQFFLLQQAYEVLSNPTLRAEYDAARKKAQPQPVPLFTTIDFMDNMEGELNRRLAVLALLYIHRRTNPYSPEVSLLEIEKRLGFPRDYLEFAAWYLRNKGYITRADNSDFTLTVEGVDFVESQRANIPILNKLLGNGTVSSPTDGRGTKEVVATPTPIIAPDGSPPSEEIDQNGLKTLLCQPPHESNCPPEPSI
jgi:curved DNA-binding protein